ncbi:hypothetical protein [Ulvibacterium sp.]|uniref:hypothetical protein n=1 Tax=Ulvibacterium sp. TaxID=2665914 RepID=UPI003BAD0379
MSSLTNRIYDELNEWKYSQLAISAALEIQNRNHKILDFVLVLISLIGIAGWFRNEELKIIWTTVLIAVQGTRLSKNLFLKSSNERFSMKNSLDFYNYHLRDLENLFFDFYDGRFPNESVDKKLRKLQDEERNIFGNQSFGTINLGKKKQSQIESQTDKYLLKIKRIINV